MRLSPSETLPSSSRLSRVLIARASASSEKPKQPRPLRYRLSGKNSQPRNLLMTRSSASTKESVSRRGSRMSLQMGLPCEALVESATDFCRPYMLSLPARTRTRNILCKSGVFEEVLRLMMAQSTTRDPQYQF